MTFSGICSNFLAKEGSALLGPGVYCPDPTEGITHPEDLPKPRVVQQSRNFTHWPCPRCGKRCYRDQVFTRALHNVGDLRSGHPRDIALTYSQHCCGNCACAPE